jgi:hypothetical protein
MEVDEIAEDPMSLAERIIEATSTSSLSMQVTVEALDEIEGMIQRFMPYHDCVFTPSWPRIVAEIVARRSILKDLRDSMSR